MTWRRWGFTAVSFAAVIGISAFFILRWWRAGSVIVLPPQEQPDTDMRQKSVAMRVALYIEHLRSEAIPDPR